MFRFFLLFLDKDFQFGFTKQFRQTGWTSPVIEDRKLTEHFSLYEMTKTSHIDLQDQNRMLTDDQISKLIQVATLWETARMILDVPVVISSGYRCPELNAKIGSTIRSQHLLCEAGDGIPKGMEIVDAFRKLRTSAKEGKITFGQMIYEKANRDYGPEWIHLSLGFPYRSKEKCGQILNMVDGAYALLETV